MKSFIYHSVKNIKEAKKLASGKSACVLHYIENNKTCKDGDVILMDFGAEYANYASDLTRCVPVNGKFTKRQKQVYKAVLYVKEEASTAQVRNAFKKFSKSKKKNKVLLTNFGKAVA